MLCDPNNHAPHQAKVETDIGFHLCFSVFGLPYGVGSQVVLVTSRLKPAGGFSRQAIEMITIICYSKKEYFGCGRVH